jgi:hypothetical protein
VLGEYIGSIHTQVHKRPLVVERERIGFDEEEARLQSNATARDHLGSPRQRSLGPDPEPASEETPRMTTS